MALSDVIAQRYAKAFFELSRDNDAVDGNRKDLAAAAAQVGSAAVLAVFDNPRVPREAKRTFAAELTGGLGTPTTNLVRLLVERSRVAVLPKVLEVFGRLADAAGGRVHAQIVSAVDLSPAQQKSIGATLEKQLGGTVETSVTTDPAIIGGLVIRIGDRVIDGSVRTRLRELQAALT